MARPTDDPVAAEWVTFRCLTTAGRSAEVCALADRIVAECDDPLRVGQALIEKLAAMINLGQVNDRRVSAAALDAIQEALGRAEPHLRLTGEFYVLSGVVAYANGSLSTAVTHLVRAERLLRQMTELTVAAADTWHDLSVSYSTMGFHAKALDAMRQGRRLCRRAGLPEALCACLESKVRAALCEDHHGRTDQAITGLEAVVRFGHAHAADLGALDVGFWAYAAARLPTLGIPVPAVAVPQQGSDPELSHLSQLTAACAAITGGEPDKALDLLTGVTDALDVFGAAEIGRLRSIAYAAQGDYRAALAEERAAMAAAATGDRELRQRYLGSVGMTLDQERLRKMAQQHAVDARSDPLTGLPNRRHLEAFVAALAVSRTPAVIGLLDLDRFKAVNDTHGHPTGDLVLQQVAAILARNTRPDDLLCRFGGDEFVFVLPTTTLDQAVRIGHRITQAVATHGWQTLAESTPVTASIGWSWLTDGDLVAALREADRELYRHKRARHAAPGGTTA
ncbi:MAG: GGDEF domain-containing protein [Hamadaea sp.]|nr:GGDEF domain-containing protein [Hamadaea sp.]NUT06242.1 GGDEF domain-containing protein [Hamadaea sp.]